MDTRWSDSGIWLWKPAALIGLNLILLAALIFVFPAFLAYLIAAFLAVNGGLLLVAAWHLRKVERAIDGRRVRVHSSEFGWL